MLERYATSTTDTERGEEKHNMMNNMRRNDALRGRKCLRWMSAISY